MTYTVTDYARDSISAETVEDVIREAETVLQQAAADETGLSFMLLGAGPDTTPEELAVNAGMLTSDDNVDVSDEDIAESDELAALLGLLGPVGFDIQDEDEDEDWDF